MAGKATAKSKVKNGIDKIEPAISMTYIDDLLLRMGKAEEDIDGVLETIDDFGLYNVKQTHEELVKRVEKVEARLGLG